MNVPSCEEFLKGCEEFERREKRDAMYKVATFLVSHFWGKPSDMADALGVLLLTWNQAFYRYGNFDFGKLEECIARNLKKIKAFRSKDISSLSEGEDKSPVAVAKALHLLAPKFFPLWDDGIAKGYGCHYSDDPAGRYIEFCKITKAVAEGVKDCVRQESNKTLVKLIDEYNYSKYTQGWI